MIQIYSFKWGKKYNHEYVNRLYGSLVKHCSLPFTYTCITDDKSGIRPEINIIDYSTWDPFPYEKNRVFTREKLVLFNHSTAEFNAWIDLDVLIHNDITDLLTKKADNFTMIWNHWFELQKKSMNWYGKGSSCHINSSFVQWNGSNARWLYDYTVQNQDKIFFTYKSLDKYLFYQHHRNNKILFWEPNIVYNYNYSEPIREIKPDHRITIFNTSHIKNNNLNHDALELHEVEGWAKELWHSYDKI
jgi:hypothetical protein